MTASSEQRFPFTDLALARRLERTEARSNADFVEARAKLFPESGACWIEVAGAYAMYDGPASPLTQTFGLGLFQAVTSVEMDMVEEFYLSRRAPVCHEVSPLADLSLIALLNARGYHPVEFTSVMFRPVQGGIDLTAQPGGKVAVHLAQEDEHEVWAQTVAKGWSESTEFADSILELMRISVKRTGGLSFLAEIDGRPIAGGAMSMCEGVALMAGASTIPEGRKQGAQRALLGSRMRHAEQQGCDIAMMCAQPGSTSQRNAERQGFRIAYTRIKWSLPLPAA
jgi:hypothetical protein